MSAHMLIFMLILLATQIRLTFVK